MNPTMEHGLGYSFLCKFVDGLSSSNSKGVIPDLSNKLTPRLRSEYETQIKFFCNLEYNVDISNDADKAAIESKSRLV